MSSAASVVFACLEDVTDALFIDQQIGLAAAIDLEAMTVIPIDDAMNLFAVLQNHDHWRARLHLLLEIKRLRVSLLDGVVVALRHAMLGGGETLRCSIGA